MWRPLLWLTWPLLRCASSPLLTVEVRPRTRRGPTRAPGLELGSICWRWGFNATRCDEHKRCGRACTDARARDRASSIAARARAARAVASAARAPTPCRAAAKTTAVPRPRARRSNRLRCRASGVPPPETRCAAAARTGASRSRSAFSRRAAPRAPRAARARGAARGRRGRRRAARELARATERKFFVATPRTGCCPRAPARAAVFRGVRFAARRTATTTVAWLAVTGRGCGALRAARERRRAPAARPLALALARRRPPAGVRRALAGERARRDEDVAACRGDGHASVTSRRHWPAAWGAFAQALRAPRAATSPAERVGDELRPRSPCSASPQGTCSPRPRRARRALSAMPWFRLAPDDVLVATLVRGARRRALGRGFAHADELRARGAVDAVRRRRRVALQRTPSTRTTSTSRTSRLASCAHRGRQPSDRRSGCSSTASSARRDARVAAHFAAEHGVGHRARPRRLRRRRRHSAGGPRRPPRCARARRPGPQAGRLPLEGILCG